MRLIKPYYEVENFPGGEEILRTLESAARTCYKSEDRIDDGRERCKCGGVPSELPGVDCPECDGRGWIQAREPSSHNLIKQILKSDRRASMVKKVLGRMQADPDFQGGCSECGGRGWTSNLRYSEMDDRIRGASIEPCPKCLENVATAIVDDAWNDDPAHESVIEHVNMSVRFICNRGVTHEMVRHRIAAYSQESTRYCNYSKGKFGSQVTCIDAHRTGERLAVWMEAAEAVERAYMKLLELGEKPQQARDILPIGLKTEIYTTYNARQWRHFFRMRCSPRAHPQMRELVVPLLLDFRTRVPILFDDIYPNMKWPEAS
jgi:thymidylate synthase (FAD)